jgi:hypothetical protein
VAFLGQRAGAVSAQERRPAADHRAMTPVIAHVGHWYHSLLYLAPLLVLVGIAGSSMLRGTPEDAQD